LRYIVKFIMSGVVEMDAFVASPVVPLIGRLRPLFDARNHPVGARRRLVRKALIRLTLSVMRGPDFSAGSIIRPIFRLLQGGELRRDPVRIIVAKVDTGANPRQS
jgi:hypothetical protein